ncbi:MAG: LytTR family DNA-binding domain-containing protein [Eubacterium sp.]|nr:LytTR family DNA-binding domain-containing protein [Eubacterium sp.]
MIRIAIVEDDELYVDQLRQYLKDYQSETGEDFEIRAYRDGDGITLDYKAQYDLILMDIQMRFVDGMTAAEEIRKMDSEVIIIFITNMAQYAIRGYEVGALDYILKPVTYFAFTQKIGRAIARLKKKIQRPVVIRTRDGVMRMDAADIYYVESQAHNLIYHTKDGVFVASGTMKQAEELLQGMNFSRGNKGYLINLEHVEGVQDKCAVVKGEKLLISRPRSSVFMQELTRYWSEVD